VRTEPLRIEQPLGPRDALERWMGQFDPKQLIRVVVAGEPEAMDAPGWLKAEMRKFVGLVDDEEIAATAAPILDPPPFDHAELGTFLPDKRFPWRGTRPGSGDVLV
jgi:hypothetical protein